MKQTAVVIAPGRGTYTKSELGYLARNHGDKAALIAGFDAYRKAQSQDSVTALDGAERYSVAKHTRGDNASALIHACAVADFMSIDRDRFDIVGVTGNSMGWYIALTCGGVVDANQGMRLVNTMGTLMQQHLIGGQLIYPFVDEDWLEISGRRAEIETAVTAIDMRQDHCLGLSIDLGGMCVLAGDEAGLAAFETEMPNVQGRFPMRLANHAAFHTHLQGPVARAGQDALADLDLTQPTMPLVDGRGALWYPKASDLTDLRGYTLGHQVTEPYDFTKAIRTAAQELCPDVFIILGPGTTLGGAVAQSLIRCQWRGWQNKADFQTAQKSAPRMISMGMDAQRSIVT